MRVPKPPARITHCIGSIPRDQLRAFVIETEADFAQSFAVHRAAQRVPILGVEQQKAATARAHQLAAERAVVAADFVPAIDALVGGAGRALALVQPVLVHQLAEAACVAALQSLLDAQTELL